MKSQVENKATVEHLMEKRFRGFWAIRGPSGIESPGWLLSYFDSAKESAIIAIILFLICRWVGLPDVKILFLLGLFFLGFMFWRGGRSAILGWQRIERFHRVIEEEKWSIEHNPKGERKELRELYSAKGFSGEQLDSIVDVLMADDQRLLMVMLEEEFGLSLESCDHPLQQALGSVLGVFSASVLFLSGFYFFSALGFSISAGLIIFFTGIFIAKCEQNRIINMLIWNLAAAALAVGITHFFTQMF